MSRIPRPALILGLAGLIPFAWGAASALVPALGATGLERLGPRLTGTPALIAYGTVILCFMSGVLWGFAARAAEHQWRGYRLSVVPALWAFFMVGGGGQAALSALLVGFLALLVMDLQFRIWGLVPPWWMRLRVLLTAGAVLCLGAGIYA